VTPGLPREGQEFAGRYRLVRMLGEGGFGTVFEAEHLRIPGRRLALKILNPLFTADPKLRDRFLREVEAASRLTHPNVIVMREVDATPEGFYFCTMDMSPGRSLRQVLNKDGRVELERAVALTAQVLDALGHAHARGVIHRDMKPENVLVEADASGAEVAKVLDFGLAKLLDDDGGAGRSQFTTPGSVVGTLQYISPEQAEAIGGVDGRADQYSVAVMLFELISGRLLFDAPSAMGFAIAHMTRQPPLLRDVAVFHVIPEELERAIQRALSKRPDERFPDALAFRAALLDAIRPSTRQPAFVVKAPPAGPALRGPTGQWTVAGHGTAPGLAADPNPKSVSEFAGMATVSTAGPRGVRADDPDASRTSTVPPPPPVLGGRSTSLGDGGPSPEPPPERTAPRGSGAYGARPMEPPRSQEPPRRIEPVRSPSQAPRAPARADTQDALPALGPGSLVGRYRIDKEIGGGGMGKVYLARHILMQRSAAVKVLQPELASEPGIRARFLREARIASVLKHPAVVELYDFDDADGRCWLAMEHVSGRPLNEALADEPGKRLTAARTARVMDQMLDALAAAHAAGVIHRDLKPSNIMLGAGDKVTVLDFGIARIHEPDGSSSAGPQLTQLGEFLGTPAYAAPEQIQGHGIDARADLYTASVILFQLLAGRRPFESPTSKGYLAKHIMEPPPALSSVRPELGRVPGLDALLARGLAKEPGARFQSAQEMRAQVLAVLAAAPAEAPPPARREAPVTRPDAPVPQAAFGVSALPTSAPGAATGAARLLLSVRGARSLRKIFLVGGTRLAFGRSREDERRGVRNHIVLRALPCRDQVQDPANWAATMRLSNAHGELSIHGAQAHVLDRSSRGISLGGAPIPKEAATPLPDAFDLDVAGGALLLRGRVLRAGGGRGGAVEAVVLKRLSNATDHAYALLVGAATLGSDPSCGLALEAPGLAPVHAILEHRQGAFRIASTAGPGDAPLLADGAPIEPGASAPLAIGRRFRLGDLELEVKELVEAELTTP